MRRTTILTLLISITVFGLSQIPYNQRYTNNIFDDILISTNIVYGTAPALQFPFLNENQTVSQELLMDIYQPVGDSLTLRPTLICAHSGAFVSGTRYAEDMVAFCDSMAHRGYVTATIDYRLGMNVMNTESSTRAVYRGVQDGRAAIRFLKETAETYGIDTNNIYILGSSAGAYIGQQNLYLDTEDERPPESYISPDLGCLDCSGNSYNHSGRTNGLIALWGALQDTTFIISTDITPIFLAHGTADATVPFGYGSAFGNPSFPATYGSSLVAEQIENYGNNVLKYFVFGQGHEFYGTNNGDWPGNPNQYWDTIFSKTEKFMYDIHKPLAGFELIQVGGNTAIFSDTSLMATSWYWDFGDGEYSTQQNPEHVYAQPGLFNVIQFVSNELYSWDTASTYAYSVLAINEKTDIEVYIYPNPAQNNLRVLNGESKLLKFKIVNSAGQIKNSFDLKASHIENIDIRNYPAGVYSIIVSDNNQIKLFKQIIY